MPEPNCRKAQVGTPRTAKPQEVGFIKDSRRRGRIPGNEIHAKRRVDAKQIEAANYMEGANMLPWQEAGHTASFALRILTLSAVPWLRVSNVKHRWVFHSSGATVYLSRSSNWIPVLSMRKGGYFGG